MKHAMRERRKKHRARRRLLGAIHTLVAFAGAGGIELERIPALLYMADVKAREYLGHPITDVRWTPQMLSRP